MTWTASIFRMSAFAPAKNRSVYLLARGCTVDESVKISSDVRSLLYGLSIGEHKGLEEEFEKL